MIVALAGGIEMIVALAGGIEKKQARLRCSSRCRICESFCCSFRTVAFTVRIGNKGIVSL